MNKVSKVAVPAVNVAQPVNKRMKSKSCFKSLNLLQSVQMKLIGISLNGYQSHFS